MSELSQAAQNLNWLITNFVDRVPGVAHTVVVSSDGLLLAVSNGFPRDRADQLAAFVDQVDREAVDLQLAQVRPGPAELGGAVGPGRELRR